MLAVGNLCRALLSIAVPNEPLQIYVLHCVDSLNLDPTLIKENPEICFSRKYCSE